MIIGGRVAEAGSGRLCQIQEVVRLCAQEGAVSLRKGCQDENLECVSSSLDEFQGPLEAECIRVDQGVIQHDQLRFRMGASVGQQFTNGQPKRELGLLLGSPGEGVERFRSCPRLELGVREVGVQLEASGGVHTADVFQPCMDRVFDRAQEGTAHLLLPGCRQGSQDAGGFGLELRLVFSLLLQIERLLRFAQMRVEIFRRRLLDEGLRADDACLHRLFGFLNLFKSLLELASLGCCACLGTGQAGFEPLDHVLVAPDLRGGLRHLCSKLFERPSQCLELGLKGLFQCPDRLDRTLLLQDDGALVLLCFLDPGFRVFMRLLLELHLALGPFQFFRKGFRLGAFLC
ncbi:hypothetical protein D7Y15_09880 [Corallococcus sp. AB030]|nr:hypothetical protein D7Y15_09880 [Corallococcus sp. AB030]